MLDRKNKIPVEQIEDFIIRAWNSGLSMGEIAIELGTTRNSISGRISRMRERGISVSVRALPPQKKKGKKANPVVLPKREKPQKLAFLSKPSEIPAVNEIFEKAKRRKERVAIMGLTDSSCRFIVEGSGAGAIFCGRKKSGKTYCEDHHKICYQSLSQYKRSIKYI